MTIQTNPFSIYAFLGYFTPGALFIYGLILFTRLPYLSATGLSGIPNALLLNGSSIYLPFILASYVLGHLLSFISAIFVERYLVCSVGYPSKYLLGLPTQQSPQILPDSAIEAKIRNFSSKWLGLANLPFYKGSDHRKLAHLQRTNQSLLKTLSLVLFFFYYLALAPISTLDFAFGHVLKMRCLYAKPSDPFHVRPLKFRLGKLLQESGSVPPSGNCFDGDYFRFIYHYAVEHSERHFTKMQNYVALFGFLRTITLVSLILFWCTVYIVFWQPHFVMISWWWILVAAIICFLFYASFSRIYRRFSLEAMMAICAL